MFVYTHGDAERPIGRTYFIGWSDDVPMVAFFTPIPLLLSSVGAEPSHIEGLAEDVRLVQDFIAAEEESLHAPSRPFLLDMKPNEAPKGLNDIIHLGSLDKACFHSALFSATQLYTADTCNRYITGLQEALAEFPNLWSADPEKHFRECLNDYYVGPLRKSFLEGSFWSAFCITWAMSYFARDTNYLFDLSKLCAFVEADPANIPVHQIQLKVVTALRDGDYAGATELAKGIKES